MDPEDRIKMEFHCIVFRDGTEYLNIWIFENRPNIRIAKSHLIIQIMEGKLIWLKKTYQKLFNPLPDDKILDWSKLKQITIDILKCI